MGPLRRHGGTLNTRTTRTPRTVRRSVLLVALASGAAALATGLAPGAGAEEPQRRIDMSRVLDAGLPKRETLITNTPPDPDPLVEKDQWVFDLRWQHGDVWLLNVGSTALPSPRATPRAIGRFALELFDGAVLIERVRFDFPLLAAFVAGDGGSEDGTASRTIGEPFSFERNLRTRVGVLFPATARGTRLELVDRASNRRWAMPWPPATPAEASGAVDGGAGTGAAPP